MMLRLFVALAPLLLSSCVWAGNYSTALSNERSLTQDARFPIHLRGAHNIRNSGCGPCVSGVCVVNKCFCDRGWLGDACDTPNPAVAECSTVPLDDSCMNVPGYGRLAAFSPERVKMAATCELEFWTQVEVPHRNPSQLVTMKWFRDLPVKLGHVLELGSGPYTKIRLLLQEGKVRRTLADVESVTLEDPLLVSYLKEAKAPSFNQEGQLCLASTDSWDSRVTESDGTMNPDKTGCIPTGFHTYGAEVPFQRHAYDTVIMMNVIEHYADARLILKNLYEALKPGGYLVFGEEYVPYMDAPSNLCHPLRITEKFFREFIETGFEPFFADSNLPEWAGLHSGAAHSFYSIARKPRRARGLAE